MGKILILILFLFLVSFVSAYTVVCENGSKGFQIWDNNQSYNETGWTIEQMEQENEMNCTLISSAINLEDECQRFEPVINQLNQKLNDNHIEIQAQEKTLKRQEFYKYFSLIFLIVSVLLVMYIWWKK